MTNSPVRPGVCLGLRRKGDYGQNFQHDLGTSQTEPFDQETALADPFDRWGMQRIGLLATLARTLVAHTGARLFGY